MHCGSIVAHIGSMYMYMYSAAEKAEMYIPHIEYIVPVNSVREFID